MFLIKLIKEIECSPFSLFIIKGRAQRWHNCSAFLGAEFGRELEILSLNINNVIYVGVFLIPNHVRLFCSNKYYRMLIIAYFNNSFVEVVILIIFASLGNGSHIPSAPTVSRQTRTKRK